MGYVWKFKNKDIYEGQSKYVNVPYIIFSERTILKEVSRKNLLTEAAQIGGNLLKHKHLRKWKYTKIKARSEKQIFQSDSRTFNIIIRNAL